MLAIKTINSLSKKDLSDKKILVRVDFNVPIVDGKVRDAYRIEKSLPTIKFLKENGAKIILISHISDSPNSSLEPVANYLKLYQEINFVHDILGEKSKNAIDNMKGGDIVLLENLRNEAGEEKNDMDFAVKLSKLADIYVNEAFSASHREHASIVGIPACLPHYMGIQFSSEITNLTKVLNPDHPFLFILGGAKFSTKIPLISKYLEIADKVFIGGAIVTNFLKAKGYEIGGSLIDPDGEEVGEFLKNPKIILPEMVLTTDLDNKNVKVTPVSQISVNQKIVDIAPEAINASLGEEIKKSALIVWNGPMGNYERGFEIGTIEILKLIAESKAKSVLGGGDTVALINKMHLGEKYTFISTGGGATLDFLAKGTLPGIEALGK